MANYEDILKQMTLEEKASLCSGLDFWRTKPIERLNIPSVLMTDGPHGLRKEKESQGTNIMKLSYPAVCFPPAVTLASSWDTDLAVEVGQAIADEAKEQGQSTVLGPGVNIKRSPLCGRNFEYFSEDPYLAGQMGASWVHGVQSQNIGVSLKHFCANNQEHIRMSIDTVCDERALREIYLPAFEHTVKAEQPTTIMPSYNKVNGEYMCENKKLLTDILRDEWGYKGITISDWGAVNNRVEGIKAGNDLEMPGNNGMNDYEIIKAVKEGRLEEADLDKVVLRLIKFAFECKTKEVPNYKTDYDKHHELARKAASQGSVLLKNEDNILPLDGNEKIAVVGALAKHIRYQGAGSSRINPTKLVSFTDALTKSGKTFAYADGYTLKGTGYKASLIKQAQKVAKDADKVIAFIGLTDEYESEGFDRSHMNMPSSHEILIEKLAQVNPNVIVVLVGGSPICMRQWSEYAKGLLLAYLQGQAAGEAIMDVLYGDVNPSGKLAETFPVRLHDSVTANYFPMGPRTVEYRESVYVGYRFYDKANKEVAYPFGYGLSYTKFEYSNLKINKDKFKENENVEVSFTVKNVGDVDGAEIAQLYVGDVESTIFRPVKELKRFKKVFLKAGETAEIKFTLDSRCFSYYNVKINDWHVESGDFDILVGASSRDIKLQKRIYVESLNPNAEIPNYRDVAPCFYDLTTENYDVPAEQFEAVLGRELPSNLPFKKGEFTMNSTVDDISITGLGKFIQRIIQLGTKLFAGNSENSQMLKASAKDMPLRSFMGFSGGVLSTTSVEGIRDMLNKKRGGFRKFRKGFGDKKRIKKVLNGEKPKK